ncbi:MAG: cyclic pyranopterin monophosphate synthase MoaC [Candidatus Sericytochromatia bacterium]
MFTHLDKNNNPEMVDVSNKNITKRTAHARATVILTKEVLDLFDGNDIKSKKGSVFQTAIIAGIMGAKKTSDLIPLCHPIGLEDCKLKIHINENNELIIDCFTSVSHKTGIEMEALTGASVAALTIYDMCKAVSHNIVIKEIKLIEKTGGKSDYNDKS